MIRRTIVSLAACVAWLAPATQAAVPIGVTQTFATQPAVADWSTLSIAGGAGDIVDTTAMEAAVQLLTAASVNAALPAVAEAGVSQNAIARWNSTRQAVQTRPTGNRYLVLMATVTNNTGTTLTYLDLSYAWAQANNVPVNESPGLFGHRTYYSLTGAAGSWTLIPGFSTFTATDTALNLSASLNLGSWAPGALIYILWADDNGPGSTSDPQEGGYAIDNFLAAPGGPLAIVRQPVGTNVTRFRPFSLSVQVTGSAPQYQWYLNDNPIDSTVNPTATNATYTVASAQESDGGTYYVIVSNSLNSQQSDAVEVVVNIDDVLPTVRQAVGSATFTEVTIQFSEIMDQASITDTANYSMAGNNPTSVLLTNGGTVAHLTFADPQTPDTDYTVTMNDLKDLAGNSVVPNTAATFHSWVANFLGGVVFQVYTNLSTTDNAIGQLTNSAKFPNSPDETYILNGLNTYEVFPVDTNLREGFGGRMRTLFVPLATGKYNFFLSSDDGSRLFLNTNGPDPAGAVLVATMDSANVRFTEPPAVGTSAAFPLTAGQGYYIEAIYKEGTGGDYCMVGARMEGDPTPASTLTNIMSSGAAAPALPKGLVGPVVISTQPANATAEEPGSATFSVVAGCTPAGPLVYQWQKSDDGGGTWADIPKANGPSYTTGVLLVVNDDQDQYRVTVKSPGGTLTSSAATLTVTADVTAPRMVSAVGSTNLTIIVVTYSEAVAGDTAGDSAAYTLTGPAGAVQVYGATVLNPPATPGIPTQVELVTDPREFGQNYTLTVEADVVRDISANANPVSPPYNTVIVAATGVIMPFVSPWRYLDVGPTNLGTAWIAPSFNDSSWPVSNALFVAKNGTPGDCVIPLNARISLTGTNGAQNLSYFFRTHIELSAYPSNVTKLFLSIVADDGAVVYLNGQELYRIGMPTGPVNWDTLANRTEGTPYLIYGPFEVPTTNLLYGDNVVAVETHQVNNTSSDIAHALQLEAQIAKIEPPRPVVIAVQPVGGTVNEGQSFTFSVQANGAPPLTYQWYLGVNPITDATNASYHIASAASANEGDYHVVVNNPAGIPATSAIAHLTVISDRTPPAALTAKGGPATNITVVVTFSEAVDPTSAQLASNYEVVGPGGLTVLGAAASGSTVTLTLSGPRTAGENYSLKVKDVYDRAFVPNLISPNPTTLPIATVIDLIAINTHSWQYLHQTVLGSPPCLDGTPWTTPGYNDSAWATGFGVFWGNRTNSANQPAPNPVALPVTLDGSSVLTILNLFTNTSANNATDELTYYFRTKFTFPGLTNSASLQVHSMIDDGAVFYLNGTRLFDVRPPAVVACTNQASAGGSQSWVPALASAGQVIPLVGLQAGQNTLAVEVHQSGTASSDVNFGLLLQAEVLTQVPPAPTLSYVYDAVAQTLTFSWTAADYSLESAPEVTGPWTVIVGASPQTVSTASGTKFYRLVK